MRERNRETEREWGQKEREGEGERESKCGDRSRNEETESRWVGWVGRQIGGGRDYQEEKSWAGKRETRKSKRINGRSRPPIYGLWNKGERAEKSKILCTGRERERGEREQEKEKEKERRWW
ncbi:uncharacterized protein BO95DRAFT_140350 [Aspergillus brunneoviolaceus CBS 621.78]|uniref:Uncharacterized protein n=1 Tax=Aspergillus brunneoviolaceus CBS 621.78 TaxID=1450534 RepID=A0ACD1G850_9EURO|nr:hypothetical protein BO95DRAFT_140350 [Aspergillus brunneoviolaceus CBS 621.78]RAH45410.1 hypothetical protein BO95DRAFT_140350 [Aspergillus brunneoviolaceus CBS 621.78]